MDNLLSSEIEVIEVFSNVTHIILRSEVDDDYRTLKFRITEVDEVRNTENDEPRILER